MPEQTLVFNERTGKNCTSTRKVALTDHPCEGCCRRIAAGDHYGFVSAFFSFALCLKCESQAHDTSTSKHARLLVVFLSQSDRPLEGCWEWRGTRSDKGYGQLWLESKMVGAHRFAYERFVAPIPDGWHIDHLCLNKGCVNPRHLEAVTPGENSRRHAALTTHCPQGHEYTEENVYLTNGGTSRLCRTCRRERRRSPALAAAAPAETAR